MMYCIKYEKLTGTVHTYTCTNNQTSSTEKNLKKSLKKFHRNPKESFKEIKIL